MALVVGIDFRNPFKQKKLFGFFLLFVVPLKKNWLIYFCCFVYLVCGESKPLIHYKNVGNIPGNGYFSIPL